MTLLLLSALANAETYAIDTAHTYVGFKVSHMTVSTARGEFADITGEVVYDPADISATTITAKVGVASVDTRNADRDDHLRSPDFFDTAQFPDATFTSTKVENVADDGSFDVVGDLTLHGVTKPVTFHFTGISDEIIDPWGNRKRGGSATTTLNRQDFGVTWNKSLDAGGFAVGDEVAVEIEVELNGPKATE